MPKAEDLSRQTREATPARVLHFLRALGTCVPIRATLAAHGYTENDHREGWRLLFKVSGYTPEVDTSLNLEADIADAIRQIDAWDGPGFRRAHAALGRLHPEQDAFVFSGLEAHEGAESVLGVGLFLERLDALESGKGREPSTRKADKAAIATLAQRGINHDERKRLAALVAKAKSSPDVPETNEAAAKLAEHRESDLTELRAWYDDWSETARAVITRRDHLIRLGLAKRKPKAKRGEPKGDT